MSSAEVVKWRFEVTVSILFYPEGLSFLRVQVKEEQSFKTSLQPIKDSGEGQQEELYAGSKHETHPEVVCPSCTLCLCLTMTVLSQTSGCL